PRGRPGEGDPGRPGRGAQRLPGIPDDSRGWRGYPGSARPADRTVLPRLQAARRPDLAAPRPRGHPRRARRGDRRRWLMAKASPTMLGRLAPPLAPPDPAGAPPA